MVSPAQAMAQQRGPEGGGAPNTGGAPPSHGAPPPGEEELPPEGEEIDESDPENDPNFVKAFNFVRKNLYEKGAADKLFTKISKAPEAKGELASFAYHLTQKADQVTGGNILDENLASLGILTLAEIMEIAEASGASIESADMAGAMKQMMIMYMEEQGMPVEQIKQVQASMNEMKPEHFEEVNNKVMEMAPDQIPDEEAPAEGAPAEEVPDE